MPLARFRTMLFKIAQAEAWSIQNLDDGFALEVAVKGAPKRVAIRFVDDEETGETWARFLSDAGEYGVLDPKLCLRLNGEDRFLTGFIGLRGERLLFLDSQLVSEADETEVKTSIRNVARYSVALAKLIDDAKHNRGTGRLLRNNIRTTEVLHRLDPEAPQAEARPSNP